MFSILTLSFKPASKHYAWLLSHVDTLAFVRTTNIKWHYPEKDARCDIKVIIANVVSIWSNVAYVMASFYLKANYHCFCQQYLFLVSLFFPSPFFPAVLCEECSLSALGQFPGYLKY